MLPWGSPKSGKKKTRLGVAGGEGRKIKFFEDFFQIEPRWKFYVREIDKVENWFCLVLDFLKI